MSREPGSSYHYNNTGYAILGEIIARVYSARSGQPRTYAAREAPGLPGKPTR